MKLLLMTLLLLWSAIHATDTFLLPDEADDALYQLRQEIASAKTSIVLITPVLDSRSIRKALIKALKHNVSIIVITHPGAPKESAHLAQYKHVSVLTHQGLQSDYYKGVIGFSLLLIDDTRATISPLALDEKAMKHDAGIMEFTSDPERLESYKKYMEILTMRSKPYLR